MIWRLRMHRIRRTAERLLVWSRNLGLAGAGIIALGGIIAPPLGLPDPFSMAWSKILLGLCLLVGGTGYALAGESHSVRDYLEGETEEMPAMAKLVSGLLASAGGLLLFAIGFYQVMG